MPSPIVDNGVIVFWCSRNSKSWLFPLSAPMTGVTVSEYLEHFGCGLTKCPQGIYEWQSPIPVCAAICRLKIFPISPTSSTKSLYYVGEQRNGQPAHMRAGWSGSLLFAYVLRSLFSHPIIGTTAKLSPEYMSSVDIHNTYWKRMVDSKQAVWSSLSMKKSSKVDTGRPESSQWYITWGIN